MKSHTLEQVQDKLIGEKGTHERDKFEYELQMDLIGKAIRQTRQECSFDTRRIGQINWRVKSADFPA